MDHQRPSIGRIVHYHPTTGTGKSTPYPAVVTHVFSDTCINLSVFDDGSFALDSADIRPTSVTLREPGSEARRTWSWPPRV